MTINIPIETYKRHLEAKRILEMIVLNIENHEAIYLGGIEAAKKIIAELKRE